MLRMVRSVIVNFCVKVINWELIGFYIIIVGGEFFMNVFFIICGLKLDFVQFKLLVLLFVLLFDFVCFINFCCSWCYNLFEIYNNYLKFVKYDEEI